MQAPLISIIIVTFNAEAYLQRCLDSIAQQVFSDREVLVIDGLSTDSTVDIIKANNSLITYWKSEKDNGIYEAMNKAVAKAQGRWLLFLGADDRLSDGFSQMAGYLYEKNTIYYGYCTIGEHKFGGGKKLNKYKVAKGHICHQSVFYPASLFIQYQYRYNLNYTINADLALNIRCWGDKRFKKQYMPFAIAEYAMGGVSAQHRDEAFRQDKPYLIKKHLGLVTYWRYLLKQKRQHAKENNTMWY